MKDSKMISSLFGLITVAGLGMSAILFLGSRGSLGSGGAPSTLTTMGTLGQCRVRSA